MYWNDIDSQFVILVKGHRFVKSIVRNVAHRPPARDLMRDAFATYVMVQPVFLDFLERRANEAYAAGFDRFDEWQFLFKAKTDHPSADHAEHASSSSSLGDQV